jgi:hypothetical protein
MIRMSRIRLHYSVPLLRALQLESDTTAASALAVVTLDSGLVHTGPFLVPHDTSVPSHAPNVILPCMFRLDTPNCRICWLSRLLEDLCALRCAVLSVERDKLCPLLICPEGAAQNRRKSCDIHTTSTTYRQVALIEQVCKPWHGQVQQIERHRSIPGYIAYRAARNRPH